ncbi:hypothetical protein ALC53_13603 [Atta colombica]|uniref:Uncharacterized protein n=1 Tax=Atta colombica TaxID=520822 RepID=A0A195AV47_9HYME|nr:hypothetical protein ALC53_13603 [Atta colombica]
MLKTGHQRQEWCSSARSLKIMVSSRLPSPSTINQESPAYLRGNHMAMLHRGSGKSVSLGVYEKNGSSERAHSACQLPAHLRLTAWSPETVSRGLSKLEITFSKSIFLLHLQNFPQFRGCKCSLQRSSSSDHDDLYHLAIHCTNQQNAGLILHYLNVHQVVDINIDTKFNIAQEFNTWIGRDFVKCIEDILHILMIRSNPIAY